MAMAAIGIDIGIADTLRAIDGILEHREARRDSVWDSLAAQLQAVVKTVSDLDQMYLSLLGEIEAVFEVSPSPERVATVVHEARAYMRDDQLLMKLMQWQGVIRSAAYSRELNQRRYRDLASALRSIHDQLGRYITRLEGLQTDGPPNYPEGVSTQADSDVPSSQRWNLRTLLELIRAWQDDYDAGDEVAIRNVQGLLDACEQAIRNYDRSPSHGLAQLVGQATEELALSRL
jgi:hypothetical protein